MNQLNQFTRQANKIKMKHNQEGDLKLLNDPIQDYEILLTPKLLKFANIGGVVDMYLKKQVDVNLDDLGLKQRLLGQKRQTVANSSRLTQPTSTAKSNQMIRSGRQTGGRQSPTNSQRDGFSRTQTTGLGSSRTQAYLGRSGYQSRARVSNAEYSLDLSAVSNPILKPGVTAEDLAARLMSHKIKTENKVRMKRQQMDDEILA